MSTLVGLFRPGALQEAATSVRFAPKPGDRALAGNSIDCAGSALAWTVDRFDDPEHRELFRVERHLEALSGAALRPDKTRTYEQFVAGPKRRRSNSPHPAAPRNVRRAKATCRVPLERWLALSPKERDWAGAGFYDLHSSAGPPTGVPPERFDGSFARSCSV
jgi:hypothetical protein